MIYKYVLGGQTIFVIYTPHELKKRKSAGKNDPHLMRVYYGGFSYTTFKGRWTNLFLHYTRVASHGFTLLNGICRQLCVKATTLPYKLNTWAFENQYVLRRYVLTEKRLPLPQRRALWKLSL